MMSWFFHHVTNIFVSFYLACGANTVFVRNKAISKPHLAKYSLSSVVGCSGILLFSTGAEL